MRGSDASSTCLRCHEAPRGAQMANGYYVATSTFDLRAGIPPSQLTPGGDFGYLKKSYSWRESGTTRNSPGERHGHNISAADYGYEADSTYSKTPGGIYPSSALSCISCHDPHGKIVNNVYRMLGGVGYKTSLQPELVFTVDAPVAIAPRDYNRPEAVTDTRVAYGRGMSEWCSNCHANGCTGAYGHPVCSGAQCTNEIISNYSAYVKSGDINGTGDTSYTSLVPFEEGTDDRSVLAQHAKNDGTYRLGPGFGSNVMCLTCHRAHASGWDHMARWNMASEFIVYNGVYPGINNGSPQRNAQGRTEAETQMAYYARPVTFFATYQRGLCNKCHPKD
ncbi:MAG: cytochrome C [Nitrospirota bacterium]